MDKICEKLKDLAEEYWLNNEPLMYGECIEKIVLRIMKDLNWKCYSNNRIDVYAPDLIDYDRNYIIDVKGCRSHYIDLPYAKNVRCIRLIKHCMDNYQKICESKSKFLDWEWYVCIFDHETDQLFFLNKNKLHELSDRIIKRDEYSNISKKLETYIYINPYDLITFKEFKNLRNEKLIKMNKLGLTYNNNYQFDNKKIFKNILKQYMNFDDDVNGLLKTQNFYIYTKYCRNPFKNTNPKEYLNEEDCLVIYKEEIDKVRYNLDNNDDNINKAYIALYVCFDKFEHELKIIDFHKLELLLGTKACPLKMTTSGEAYNISRRLLDNDNDIFF